MNQNIFKSNQKYQLKGKLDDNISNESEFLKEILF